MFCDCGFENLIEKLYFKHAKMNYIPTDTEQLDFYWKYPISSVFIIVEIRGHTE